MDLAEIKAHECEALFAGRLMVIYDEFEACITSKGKTIERLSIKEVRQFAEKLNMAKDDMLENYKEMDLDRKMEYCRRNGVSYRKMQELVTKDEMEGLV